jgi:UDP-N-acetylenolpyruvoylglucosamine reductase
VGLANWHEFGRQYPKDLDLNKKFVKIRGKFVPFRDGRVPVAYLISEAGLKGVSFGGAIISPQHANFIVNVLNATANDVKNLIQLAKGEVKRKFGIDLEEEIVYL